MSRLKKNLQYLDPTSIARIDAEMHETLRVLNNTQAPLVTFFGAHATKTDNPWYAHAERTAQALGEAGYGVVTGAGPGIMEAANKGAYSTKAPSIGFAAALLKDEQRAGDYFTEKLDLEFIFVRRFGLSIKSEALLFYPGGYGTLNELFEFVTLIQVAIVDSVPMICVGSAHWRGLFAWVKEKLLDDGYVTPDHLDLVQFADTTEEIMKIVTGHP